MYRSWTLFFVLVPLLLSAVHAAPHHNVLLLISDTEGPRILRHELASGDISQEPE